jgi:hypothetical protein
MDLWWGQMELRPARWLLSQRSQNNESLKESDGRGFDLIETQDAFSALIRFGFEDRDDSLIGERVRVKGGNW